jgi:predicted RNA binding protein YcfA (HicA-like mRNA interferase family)
MKLPRNLSGAQLIKALEKLGYQTTRQTGSHVRITSPQPNEHHLTVPLHDPLRIGTLAAILADVAAHHGITRDALLAHLFGK